MEYDGILKWGETETGWNDCNVCYFNPDCKGTLCSRTRKTFRDETGIHFAHADQLEGLIEEAEAGAQAWVRENTLFVCSRPNSCSINDGIHCSSHLCATACTDPCLLNGCAEAVCKPYRGKKGEPQKFSGIDKRIIESLIEECDAEAKQPSGDFTKLESFTATVQGIKAKPTAEDCSEVEALPEWADDGHGCLSCKFLSTEKSCLNAQRSECGVDTGYCMYERKEDRSDLEYNKKSEFLRDEAGEVINSGGIEIVINDDLTPLSDIKVKAEVQEDGVEYVVVKDFKHFDLAITDMAPVCFKQISSECQNLHFCKDEIIRFKSEEWDIVNSELLRLGFIEKKVNDPVVKLGDVYQHSSGYFAKALRQIGGKLRIQSISSDGFISTKQADGSNLSSFVGAHSLSEFKKVNVEITEVMKG